MTSIFGLAVIAGLGYLGWQAVTGLLTADERDALDASDVVRSAVVAVAMYLAMLAIAIGSIDLLQAVAGARSPRIAGGDSDLARGLALLLVGVPIFAGLLRTVRAWQTASATLRPGVGWTLHAVAALTTCLVAALVSAAQIIDDIVGPASVNRDEIAQLVGWLAAWSAYWFGLRPWLGVRGVAHLAFGSIIGLGWLAFGLSAGVADIATEAYHSLFDPTLARDADAARWLLVAAVGALVWGWHWPRLNRPAAAAPGPTSTHDIARHSTAWFVAVVPFAIVPALIASLIVAGTSISGVLIWLFGSTTNRAVDHFESAPTLIVVGLVSTTIWSWFGWQIRRAGGHGRNEAHRFHDYAVAAVGLGATIAATALIIQLGIEALGTPPPFASGSSVVNRLIGSVTALAIGGAVWWRTWRRIDAQRGDERAAEQQSIWRKLYLIVVGGTGGLLLAISTIWTLFVLLRDLFDTVLGRTTLISISGPLGLALAVLGSVWFHTVVWRDDRRVLALPAATRALGSHGDTPPPPTGARLDADGASPTVAVATDQLERWLTHLIDARTDRALTPEQAGELDRDIDGLRALLAPPDEPVAASAEPEPLSP